VRQKILKLLKDINSEILDDDSILLVDNDFIDSFGIANLVGAIEEEFKIEIDGEDVLPENFNTIAKIEALIQKYTK